MPRGRQRSETCARARGVDCQGEKGEKDDGDRGAGCREENSKGMPGRMARQQSRQPGQGHHRKGLRNAVPCRHRGRAACARAARRRPRGKETTRLPAGARSSACAKSPPARSATQAPPPAATAPTGVNQYTTEAQAKARCGTGTVVWANLDSKIYHFASYKNYGNTKSGAYMCERDATGQGMRASKNEKHP